MLKRTLAALALVALLARPADAVPYVIVHTGTTVGLTAVVIDTTASHFYEKVWNNCSVTLYVGYSAAITSTTGIPVPAGTWIEFSADIATGNRLYGIVGGSTCDTRTLEVKS